MELQAFNRSASRPNQTNAGEVNDVAAFHSQEILAKRIAQSVIAIERCQHPNGEILSYRRDKAGNYLYCRGPFISALVYDELGCFDLYSSRWQDGSLDLIPIRMQQWFVQKVNAIRQRIRGFLSWQQESNWCWRFFGRGSGIDPDINTTVEAALALLDGDSSGFLYGSSRLLDAIQTFHSTSGWYYTFYRPGRGGYGWLDDLGSPVVGFDRVVNAEVLRCLALLGLRDEQAAERLRENLLGELAQADLSHGTVVYPHPVSFLYATSRAWDQGALPDQAKMANLLLPWILSLQKETGDFGGALSNAMGASVLLNLGCLEEPLYKARQAILRGLQIQGGWLYEDFLINGFGSPALSTALSLSALARCACVTGGYLV
jgi:hypothetical protein